MYFESVFILRIKFIVNIMVNKKFGRLFTNNGKNDRLIDSNIHLFLKR